MSDSGIDLARHVLASWKDRPDRANNQTAVARQLAQLVVDHELEVEKLKAVIAEAVHWENSSGDRQRAEAAEAEVARLSLPPNGPEPGEPHARVDALGHWEPIGPLAAFRKYAASQHGGLDGITPYGWFLAGRESVAEMDRLERES